MKNKIYIAVACILLLISLSLLLLYYTQDFKEDVNIYKEISYENIIFSMNNDRLDSASAEIGDLILENKGYFTQKYYYPIIIGCVNMNSGPETLKFSVRVLDLDYTPQTYRDSYFYYQSGEFIEVKSEVKILKKLVGVYEGGYNQPSSLTLSKENIKDITIYEIKRKETNPLAEDYYSSYVSPYSDCSSLQRDLDPIARILVV